MEFWDIEDDIIDRFETIMLESELSGRIGIILLLVLGLDTSIILSDFGVYELSV